MNALYQSMKQSAHQHNASEDMMLALYGLSKYTAYDAILLAPSWTPDKIFKRYHKEVTVLKQGQCFTGYEVRIGQQYFGFIQTGVGAANIIDCCMTLGSSVCDTILFIGAVGSLRSEISLGEIVIPKYSIAGDGGSLYLYDKISVVNFRNHVYPNQTLVEMIKEIASDVSIALSEHVVYCIDSIFCEYYHLSDIKSLGSELIEMETAAFMRSMELIGKAGIPLLCVSDNSAAGQALIGRSKEDTAVFHDARESHIPTLLFELVHRIRRNQKMTL